MSEVAELLRLIIFFGFCYLVGKASYHLYERWANRREARESAAIYAEATRKYQAELDAMTLEDLIRLRDRLDRALLMVGKGGASSFTLDRRARVGAAIARKERES